MKRFNTPQDVFEQEFLEKDNYVNKKLYLARYLDNIILRFLKGYDTWVDLGSQKGNYGVINLLKTPEFFSNKVAVEIQEDYIAQDTRDDWVKINMSAQDFMDTLQPINGVVTMFDVIEHLEKDDALDLLSVIEEKANFVVLFTPDGFDEGQNNYDFVKEVSTEQHLCGFTVDEFQDLGYRTVLLKNFHIDKKDNPEHEEQDNFNAIIAFKVTE